MPESTGARNNNYLNVKNTTPPWLDANGKEAKSDGRKHAVFTDPAYGVRAGIRLLRTYYFKHNLKTIAEILSRWAPSGDTIGSLPGAPKNSPLEYSTFVAGRMGISFNQKLDIFNEDKSIGNISRLRGLFAAMAEFENGKGFKVPAKVFNAGLELAQPGIISHGARTGHEASLENAAHRGAAAANNWSISASVGRKDKGAANNKDDVETVQNMLRQAAMILGDPRLDPGPIDGKIGNDPKKSGTIKAIVAFQSRFLTSPDGLIEVGGRTWRELFGAITEENPDPQPHSPFFFPFSKLPTRNWTQPPRSFGSSRSKGKRVHAGCDLYFPKGTIIHAITDGTVIQGPYPFYQGTFALEVDHGAFIARYGEIQQTAFVRPGERVVGGQPIAKVGHLVGIVVESDMLHLELYDKSAHGPLTTKTNTARDAQGRPFNRRRDLINPTAKLNEWKNNLPSP
jgi:murein DD-endopeptidase MepM/ murein hydrolase activator NlpD